MRDEPAGGRHDGGVDVVLHGNRYTGQRTERRAGCAEPIEAGRALECPVAGNQVEGVQRGVQPFNAIERVSTDVNSRDPAIRDIPGNRADPLEMRAHPMTRGTRKRPASGAPSGALRSASATGRQGRS